jgi:hypothetical protein
MKRYRVFIVLAVILAIAAQLVIDTQKTAADAYDDNCANIAAGDTGTSGFARFPSSVDLYPGQTAITTFRTYVCNANDSSVRDWSYMSASSMVVETGRTNVIDFGPTGWSGPSGGFYLQDMGTFAPHEWRKRDVNMGIREAAFDGPGTYTIRVQGRGRVWDSGLGCYYPNPCYRDTNTITINLRLTVNRPDITCGGTTLSPANPELGQSFTATSNYAASDGSLNNAYQLAAYLRNPAGTVVAGGADVPYTIISPNSLRYNFPSWADGGQGGVYTVTTSLSIPGAAWFDPVDCSASFTVANRPYHKVYGGDVFAGAAFGSPCYDASARIMGFNAPNFTLFGLSVGSGSQLASFALNTIHEFGSGQIRNSSDPANFGVKHLAFANTAGTYGGNLSNTHAVCAPDFWAGATNILPNNQPIAGRNLANGAKQTIYVEGNAYVHGNVTYTGDPLTGNYNNLSSIPSFRLIVRGNIYVAQNVTELNGLFVALPRPGFPNSGKFYTCGSLSGFGPPTTAQLDGSCRTNRLTVYGAVVADLIKFTRSGGSLTNANQNERYNSGGDPAERFIYTPEVWLTSDFTGNEDLDSAVTLPPIL